MKIKHIIFLVALTALVIFFSILPFFSGRYFDGVLSLALIAQLIGVASIILTPLGLVWFAYRRWKHKSFSVLPLYFVLIPSIAFIAQLALTAPLTERSRSIAIENSREMISDIESYYTEHGSYPVSLFGVWPDYLPGIIGVPRYYYEPSGEAYNLVFEQPRFLLDDLGAREFVVYNKLDQHIIRSHRSFMFRLSPEEFERYRGYFAESNLPEPHWKSFLFD